MRPPLPFSRTQGRTGVLRFREITPPSARGAGSVVLLLAILLAAGCRPGDDAGRGRADDARLDTLAVLDDAGRDVVVRGPARRVVSLLPAGTQTLVAVGAADALVGRTRYDVDPALAHLPSVGGGLDPSLEALTALRPDLVIAFETAGGSPLRERLEALGVAVFGIQTQDTADIFRNTRRLGHLVGRDASADSVIRAIRDRFAALRASAPPPPRPTVLYLASVDPPIVAGRGTYISEIIGVVGGRPVPALAELPQLWPQVSVETLVRAQPDLVVLPIGEDPTASLDRLRTSPGWRELRAVREGRVARVPADLLNRPGPSVAEAADTLAAAIRAILARP